MALIIFESAIRFLNRLHALERAVGEQWICLAWEAKLWKALIDCFTLTRTISMERGAAVSCVLKGDIGQGKTIRCGYLRLPKTYYTYISKMREMPEVTLVLSSRPVYLTRAFCTGQWASPRARSYFVSAIPCSCVLIRQGKRLGMVKVEVVGWGMEGLKIESGVAGE
jgi:hypothetical protein